MITNRTEQDVIDAKTLIMEKVQNFVTLTAAEKNTLERGTLTLTTINRIESKAAELIAAIKKYCYSCGGGEARTAWTKDDVFTSEDFKRILEYTESMRSGFFIKNDTPETPDTLLKWDSLNSEEQILSDLAYMVDDIKKHFRQCGTFECGEVNNL